MQGMEKQFNILCPWSKCPELQEVWKPHSEPPKRSQVELRYNERAKTLSEEITDDLKLEHILASIHNIRVGIRLHGMETKKFKIFSVAPSRSRMQMEEGSVDFNTGSCHSQSADRLQTAWW